MPENPNDPMPVIRVLLQRLSQEAGALGLEMDQAVIIPSRSGEPDMLQAVFSIRPAAVEQKSEEALADEKAVEEMFKATQEDERTAKNKAIADDVASWLEDM